jgi:hypothetical protein
LGLPTDPFGWHRDGEVDIFERQDGEMKNDSCLHWGHHNGDGLQKSDALSQHPSQDLDRSGNRMQGLAWKEPLHSQEAGSCVWDIDSLPVVEAEELPGSLEVWMVRELCRTLRLEEHFRQISDAAL